MSVPPSHIRLASFAGRRRVAGVDGGTNLCVGVSAWGEDGSIVAPTRPSSSTQLYGGHLGRAWWAEVGGRGCDVPVRTSGDGFSVPRRFPRLQPCRINAGTSRVLHGLLWPSRTLGFTLRRRARRKTSILPGIAPPESLPRLVSRTMSIIPTLSHTSSDAARQCPYILLAAG